MATAQSKIANIDLTVTRKKQFTIDGDENRIIELNTSDMSILSRIQDSYQKLEDLSNRAMSMSDSDFEETAKTLKEIDGEMRDLINYIFDSDIADTCAPEGTMYAVFNGQFRFEHILDRLISLYENNMDKEFKKYAVKGRGLSSMTLDRYEKATDAYINPTIIEERKLNVASMDVFSRLMMDRIIFLGVPIDDDVANIIQAQLLFLASTDPSADISLYINTPGGQVTSGLAIYDTMQLVEPDVATICTGMAASMGSVLLCAGAKGKRSCLPHSKVLIHQPLGGAQGQASDIMIAAKEIEKTRKELYEIISEHSGQVPSDIDELMKLPGVGRKTANVIASIVYDKPVIAVDTHVFRVAHRLGLSDGSTPYAVEQDMERHIPMEQRPIAHHWLILHGRYTCTARNPKCADCPLTAWCREYPLINK